MRLHLGLDLGTSAVKAVALNDQGDLVAHASAPYPTNVPQADWAEQQPLDWTSAAMHALQSIVLQFPQGARPIGMALSGQLPTLALLAPDGIALRPAIVWYDGRSSAQAEAFLRTLTPAQWYQRTGVILDAHYLAPMYSWIALHQPHLLVQPHRLCSAKDALLHALTGTWHTDPSTASGFGLYSPLTGQWDAELCRTAGIETQTLPEIAQPWSIAGGLSAAWAQTGLPVGLPICVGAGDALTGVLGCGAADEGTLAIITGTSTSLVATSPVPRLDQHHRFLLTPHALPSLWGLEMDLMSTGSALHWLASMLGLPGPGALLALAQSSPPGAHGLFALPYLAGGEQGALWDPHAPAAFVGLSLQQNQADLARALLEGIAFEMRRCLLAWHEAQVPVREVVLTGGHAGPPFAEILASVLGVPVRVSAAGPASAIGAALLAGLGMEAWDVPTALRIARRGLGETLAPSPDDVVEYARRYEQYDRFSTSLRQPNLPVS